MKLDIEGYFMGMDRKMLYDKVLAGMENNKAALSKIIEYILTADETL